MGTIYQAKVFGAFTLPNRRDIAVYRVDVLMFELCPNMHSLFYELFKEVSRLFLIAIK